jgi:hypothetical protein
MPISALKSYFVHLCLLILFFHGMIANANITPKAGYQIDASGPELYFLLRPNVNKSLQCIDMTSLRDFENSSRYSLLQYCFGVLVSQK